MIRQRAKNVIFTKKLSFFHLKQIKLNFLNEKFNFTHFPSWF